MKTFKLKGLQIMPDEEDVVEPKEIVLHDGLVINREDDLGWLIEAYIDRTYWDYFTQLEPLDELMIQIKITREENDPAFFVTKIVGINEIGNDKMNVLFQGKIVDHSKRRIEKMLEMIIEEGYQGRSLLEKFKELI
ncbi:MAG TPA: YwpF family protein [Pseudogracilibacillus sp.]|nr:YwpF family protein [Pseudogracilibacillus sp.]